MSAARYQVALELAGPILTGATNPGELGVDSPFARHRDGRLYFPGTLIKGKLLQAWEVLRALPLPSPTPIPTSVDCQAWLGVETGNREAEENGRVTKEGYLPARGRALFADFVDASSAGRKGQRVRIGMDETRGSADEGMMQIMESLYGSGEPATFVGHIDFFPRHDEDRKRFPEALRLGLSAVPSFGAERGIGFGRVKSVTVLEVTGKTPRPRVALPEGSLGLKLSTEDLICIAQRQAAGNLYASADIIPGGAIKGALAQNLKWLDPQDAKFPHLLRNLSRIRIRHARPVLKDGPQMIPPAIPLSAVVVKKKVYDAVLCPEAKLIDGEAPAFFHDWKGKAAQEFFGISEPDTELRVRTRIDRNKRRAEDERLFAYESVVPDGHVWLTNLDFRHVPDAERAAVRSELEAALAGGLAGVGKTKARFEAEPGAAFSDRFPHGKLNGKQLVIQLQTAALLGSPVDWRTARNASHVKGIYREVWRDLSNGNLALSHYFAAQEFAGGLYLHRRFGGGQGQYQPWLLTSAGSVFVFEAPDDTIGPTLDLWRESGLPLRRPVLDGYGLKLGEFELWEQCPYVPENGFGEIGVNLHQNWEDQHA